MNWLKLEGTEHDEQSALFQWAEFQKSVYPQLSNLFAIPNGGKRHIGTAVKLKAEGVKAGVPDLFLAQPSGDFAGLFIELKSKSKDARLRKSQQEWLKRLRLAGYKTCVCYGWEQAAIAICDYLDISTGNRPTN